MNSEHKYPNNTPVLTEQEPQATEQEPQVEMVVLFEGTIHELNARTAQTDENGREMRVSETLREKADNNGMQGFTYDDTDYISEAGKKANIELTKIRERNKDPQLAGNRTVAVIAKQLV